MYPRRQFLVLGALTVLASLLAGCGEEPSKADESSNATNATNASNATSNVWPQNRCQGNVSSKEWPSFDSFEDLEADATWAKYFAAVYGEIPKTGYPICTSSLTWISTAAFTSSVGKRQPQECWGDNMNADFAYVDSMSACCDPGTSVATFLWNVNNIGHAIPSNTWVEVMHVYFENDEGYPWYYVAQGSAVWAYTGHTKVYKDHPDAVQDLLGWACHDNDSHDTKPATECEDDFQELMWEASTQGYDSIQFTNHYDCNCGTYGPSSWDEHWSWCQTELIDLTGDARTGCPTSKFNLRTGWNAQDECFCDSSKSYTNCDGSGVAAIDV